MMIPPIGIVNACNPKQAALDAVDASSALQSPLLSYAPYSAAALAAGIAEGLKPDATVDSMIDAGIRYCGEENVADVIKEVLDIAKEYSDIYEVREPLWQRFGGRVPTDSLEVASESFAMFYIAKGDPHLAGVGGTNLGRDSDCVASLGAALAGALKGVDSVRGDWIEKVDKAVKKDPHTIIDMSIEEQAKALYDVFQSNIDELKTQVELVESMTQAK
jgi:ADP-ribosylglycohydrolase